MGESEMGVAQISIGRAGDSAGVVVDLTRAATDMVSMERDAEVLARVLMGALPSLTLARTLELLGVAWRREGGDV